MIFNFRCRNSDDDEFLENCKHEFEGRKAKCYGDDDDDLDAYYGGIKQPAEPPRKKPEVKFPTMDQIMNPEAHGMKMCPHCDGYGSSLEDPPGVDRCSVCGGSGLVLDKTKKKPADLTTKEVSVPIKEANKSQEVQQAEEEIPPQKPVPATTLPKRKINWQ